MKKQNGFTLVELAIVLMIIGLLIGGILRGQELMQTARITSTIQQVKSYQGATNTFNDAYAALPGDMMNALNRLPGCTAASSCQNGNGNGFVDNAVTTGDAFGNITNSVASENSQFWKHLALAHLITGIDPSAATPDWGKTLPVAKTGGGFFLRYTDLNAFNSSNGHYFLLRKTFNGAWQCGAGGNPISDCAISPQAASQIDRKMDNGIALTGDVFALSSTYNSGCGNNNAGSQGSNGYDETRTDNACDMAFKL